jgi:hypothetical protein
MICSTINRNPKLRYGDRRGEYVMRWLPKGTHEWSKFITPDELYDLLRIAGLDPVDRKGFVFNPVTWSWSISARDLSVQLRHGFCETGLRSSSKRARISRRTGRATRTLSAPIARPIAR